MIVVEESRDTIIDILEKYFGNDKQFDNFIVTTEYRKYDLVANEIIELVEKGLGINNG